MQRLLQQKLQEKLPLETWPLHETLLSVTAPLEGEDLLKNYCISSTEKMAHVGWFSNRRRSSWRIAEKKSRELNFSRQSSGLSHHRLTKSAFMCDYHRALVTRDFKKIASPVQAENHKIFSSTHTLHSQTMRFHQCSLKKVQNRPLSPASRH